MTLINYVITTRQEMKYWWKRYHNKKTWALCTMRPDGFPKPGRICSIHALPGDWLINSQNPHYWTSFYVKRIEKPVGLPACRRHRLWPPVAGRQGFLSLSDEWLINPYGLNNPPPSAEGCPALQNVQ